MFLSHADCGVCVRNKEISRAKENHSVTKEIKEQTQNNMKKTLLTTILCVATVALAMAAATSTQPADTTGDGKVTTADAELIYSYILGTADEEVPLEQVDVNGDDTVNTLDVVAVYVAMNTPEEPDGMEGYGNDSDDSEFGY